MKEDCWIIGNVLFGDVRYNEEFLKKISPRLRQVYVSLGPVLITTSLGMAEGYSAILIPQLQKEQIMDIDVDLESWIASIAALPMPFACFFGGILMELIGRKYVHMLCCVICLIGWVIIYFSTTSVALLIGRFITGFCVGLIGAATCVYIAETSEPTFRSVLLAAVSFAITLGIVLSHILGTFFSWQTVALICCVFPVVTLSIMTFAPESPTYLAKKGRKQAATDAFYWCRGRDDKSKKELDILFERQSVISDAPKQNFLQYLRPEFWKPLALMIVFFLTMQWCGSNAITFYNVTILQQSLDGSIDEYLSMLLMDGVRLVASILACYLLNKISRRGLALVSCAGVTLSLFTLSAFIYCSKEYPVLKDYNWIILTAFIAYMIFLTVGVIPVPWAMVGEVFPLANRGVGSGISALVNYALIFFVVKSTPFLFKTLDTEGTFLLFGCCCLVGAVILAMFLPETKDKPLHEIEDYFKGIRQSDEVEYQNLVLNECSPLLVK